MGAACTRAVGVVEPVAAMLSGDFQDLRLRARATGSVAKVVSDSLLDANSKCETVRLGSTDNLMHPAESLQSLDRMFHCMSNETTCEWGPEGAARGMVLRR